MRINGSDMMPGCNVASIVGKVDGHMTKCGEVYLYDDGTASVYDDLWGDPTRWFSSKEHGHHDAMVAVVTRIIEQCELVW